MTIKILNLEEPKLVFGDDKRFEDPKLGIISFGPHSISGKHPSPSEMKIGIIGSASTIHLTKAWIEKCRKQISSKSSDEDAFSFPGFSKESPFKCEIQYDDEWVKEIDSNEIASILKIDDDSDRIAKTSSIFKEKMLQLKDKHPQPNVIICSIPEEIAKSLATRGGKLKTLRGLKFENEERKIFTMRSKGQTFLGKFIEGIDDPVVKNKGSTSVWKSLKVAAMEIGIPIQVILPRTFLDENLKEDDSIIAWNMFTALYYKSGGYPWRLHELDPNTCYVGISFYRDVKVPDPTLRTALAQIFTPTGESLILKGDKIRIDSRKKSAHLSMESATLLLKRAIKLYEQHTEHKPVRVVIHKTSTYTDEEKEGFIAALEGIQTHDFVAIVKRKIRFMRAGENPPIRGTMIKLSEKDILLYTHGYIPYLRVYRGSKLPEPLGIEYDGDSTPEKICKEILSLTKLNWNSANYSLKFPLTIIFSKNVGSVLSELDENAEINNKYAFYM